MVTASARVSTQRWWDIPAAILLFAAIVTASIRLAATNWTEDLVIIQYVAVLGLAAGLALGQSFFSRKVVVFLATAYGVFVIGWQLGRLMSEGILWSERLLSLGGRLGVSVVQLLQRKPVNDPLLFLTVMALIFWILSVQAGYSLTRHGNTWQAALPIGLAMFVIHIHDPYWPYRAWFLATYIFFSLLLLARITYLHSHARWKKTHTRLPPYLGLDLIRSTLLVTAILVLLAWTAPALASSVPLAERAWNRLSRPWMVARGRMSNAFASLRASVGLVYDYYGDTLPLGRGNNLTDDILLTIKTPQFPDTVRRFYWRARVYDHYEDGLWSSNFDDREVLSPQNFNLNLPQPEAGRWSATLDITPWVPLTTLFVIPQPEWVSRPVTADLVNNPDGTVDLAALHAVDNLQAGEVYQVRASISAVTESELREAGTDYPDWITERYLQLPDTVTKRTRDLARQIDAGHDNPYDKTVAVINYLRNNIRYSDTVPTPPSDQDPVDWVLFDLKQGFCNYYATSAIVLLREMGIPARWAVGYAQGEYNPSIETYIVRQREAHSWPEVYFPGVGWVEFEPTLSQPTLQRPEGIPQTQEEQDDLAGLFNPDGSPGLNTGDDVLRGVELAESIDIAGDSENVFSPITAGVITLVAVGLIGVSLFAWRSRRPRLNRPIPQILEAGFRRFGFTPPRIVIRWSRSANLPPIARAYNEINKSLNRLGRQPEVGNTPAERAAVIAALLPSVAGPAQTLVHEYQQVTYGRDPGDIKTARENARTIRNRSWLAWVNRLLARFQEK